jgi:hypothetical protein
MAIVVNRTRLNVTFIYLFSRLELVILFDVFLTVHHDINLFNYQLDAQFLYSLIYVLH